MFNLKLFITLRNNDLVVPGLAEFIYTTYPYDTCAGSAVYIIRSYNRVNQLHESGGVWICHPTRVCIGGGFTMTTVFIGITIASIVGVCVFCVNMFGDLVLPVSARGYGRPGVRRLVKCHPFIRLFLSLFTSLVNRWNCFLCVYRRL